MRELRNLLLTCFLLPIPVFAQDAPESSASPSGPRDQPQVFVVELTEIEDWNPDPLKQEPNLDARQLLRESKRDGSHRQRSIRRISAVEGIESYAQFGKRVPVVVSKTVSPNSTEYGYEDENVGTELRVTVTRRDKDRLRVKLLFASSDVNLRPDGAREDVEVIIATGTHTMTPGVPVIVDPSHQYTQVSSGRRREQIPHKSSLLILSVETAEQNETANRSTHRRGH